MVLDQHGQTAKSPVPSPKTKTPKAVATTKTNVTTSGGMSLSLSTHPSSTHSFHFLALLSNWPLLPPRSQCSALSAGCYTHSV